MAVETSSPSGDHPSPTADAAANRHAQSGRCERLVIVSGPSGAGKSTVLRRLVQECRLPLVMSVSATTRRARPGEQDGVDYHFLTREEFARRRAKDEFLECQEVFHRDEWYGTLRSEVWAGLNRGDWVILEIDVKGAEEVLRQYPSAISIFLHPGSEKELERRLRNRNTESEDSIRRRLQSAREELAKSRLYLHKVTNDTVEHAVAEICRLLLEHARQYATSSP